MMSIHGFVTLQTPWLSVSDQIPSSHLWPEQRCRNLLSYSRFTAVAGSITVHFQNGNNAVFDYR